MSLHYIQGNIHVLIFIHVQIQKKLNANVFLNKILLFHYYFIILFKKVNILR